MENEFAFGSVVFHKSGGYPMVIISNQKTSGMVTVRYWNETKGIFTEDNFYTAELKPKEKWLSKDAGVLEEQEN